VVSKLTWHCRNLNIAPIGHRLNALRCVGAFVYLPNTGVDLQTFRKEEGKRRDARRMSPSPLCTFEKARLPLLLPQLRGIWGAAVFALRIYNKSRVFTIFSSKSVFLASIGSLIRLPRFFPWLSLDPAFVLLSNPPLHHSSHTSQKYWLGHLSRVSFIMDTHFVAFSNVLTSSLRTADYYFDHFILGGLAK